MQNFKIKISRSPIRVVVRVLVEDPRGQWFESQVRHVDITFLSLIYQQEIGFFEKPMEFILFTYLQWFYIVDKRKKNLGFLFTLFCLVYSSSGLRCKE